MHQTLLLAAAAFGAGVLNAIAGGGSFLTFPALILTGVPDVSANATSAVAVCPGYLGAAAGFRDEIRAFDRRQLIRILALTALGGLIGSGLLLVSSARAFGLVVPFLLALATLAFAFGPRLRHRLAARPARAGVGGLGGGGLGVLAVAIYGGYFNGGLGIILLALFSFWGMRDLNQMNGLKNAAALLISVISVVTFAASGLVAWQPAILMMVAATAGGYAGAPLARVLPAAVVRGVVVAVGAVLSLVFLIRALQLPG